MKRIIIIMTLLIAWNSAQAETKENRAENPHELRIGVGDCSIYYAQRYSTSVPPPVVPGAEEIGDSRHFDLILPNIFIDYQYRVNSWFAAGVQVNTIWDKGTDYSYNYAMQLETKGDTRNVWHTFAAQATLLGISVGKNHWFGTFEAGALFTGRSMPDRCFNFAVGYRF